MVLDLHRVMSALFLGMITLSWIGCAGKPQTKGGLADYDPALAARLVREENALMLDVRSPAEYRATHVPGARNIPIDDFRRRLKEVAALVAGDKNRPIVVYCTRGGRAAEAKEILLRDGYTRVTNLGAITDWPRP